VFHDSRSSAIVSQPYCTLLAVPNLPVTVVGIGADGWDGLSPGRASALSAAQVIIGGSRQLDLLPEAVTGKRVLLPSPLLPGLKSFSATTLTHRSW
jgi:precorrin-6Y C5,15-methyltransferase (decarboxylating)